MEYISAKEAADKWGVSQRRVSTLCSEQRIDGATMVGNMWLVPKNAKKPIDARMFRNMNFDSKKVKPFLKWAGGKGQLIPEIEKLYPFKHGKINKYAEPFVGGGAILFDILNKFDLQEIYISDINSELVNTYNTIRNDIDTLIEKLYTMQNDFLPLNTDERKAYYTDKRNSFNELKIGNDRSVNTQKAALMIFLNKTCFNGLYRVNKKGLFNVPMGAYKNPMICDENNLRAVSEKLRKVTIVCGDYRASENFIDSNTFVYFDPPYRPLNVTSSFTSYTENNFNDDNQIELAKYITSLADRGICVVASNSDPKNINSEDNFFDELYNSLEIKRINANRMINSNASARGKITELLIHSNIIVA